MKTIHLQLFASKTGPETRPKHCTENSHSWLRIEGLFKLRQLALAACAATGLLFGSGSLLADNTDDKIEAAAKSSYVFKTYLAGDAVKLDAKDGVVTLTGSVLDESHKMLAQETVAGLPGVTGVDNQIKIKEPQPENSDAWLALKVKSALAFHKGVSAYGTEVKVKDGVVTLKGEAASEAVRDLTHAYAEDIDGVKGVVNEMKVAPEKGKHAKPGEESVDDASITAQVRVALLTHRSTRSSHMNVSTHEGTLTLKGTVKNEAEEALILKLVNDIHGVKEVVNKIKVESEPLDN